MKSINYMQNVSEVANANSEAITSMFEISLRAAQQLGELNGDFVKAFVNTARTTGVSGDIDQRMQAQAKLFERSNEYFRDLTDVISNAAPEIARLNAQRMESVMDLMAEQAKQFSSVKQNGGSNMAELMKTSFFNPTAAYESMFNMTREMLDSSLGAVAKASSATKSVTTRTSGESKRAA